MFSLILRFVFYQILYTIAYFLFLNLLKLSSLFIKLYLFIYLCFRVFNNLAAVVGKGVAEKAILSSKRYTAEEALAIGMVDKVVPKEKLIDEAKSQMDELTVFSGEKCS